MTPAPPSSSRLMAVMFTDIARSVDIKCRIGDADYARLIQRHDELFRAALAHAAGGGGGTGGGGGGEILQDAGDGFLARFDTPSDAVNAALQFQHAVCTQPWPGERPRIRIGLHAGEVTVAAAHEAGPARHLGLAIDTAARITALALPGQILLSRAIDTSARQYVRHHPAPLDDAPTPELRWAAHGHYLFQGLPEPIEVFEVGAVGVAPFAPPPDADKARRRITPEEEELLGWRPAPGVDVARRPGWVLERKLGEGGFGEVWLGVHRQLRERRVFKFCFDLQRLKSFKREITIFRLIREKLGDQPGIARLYDFQLDHPPYTLEGEYSELGSLRAWAAIDNPLAALTLHDRLAMVADIADAANAAHAVGVIHRDIKPGNILLFPAASSASPPTSRPRPRLADFGIGVVSDASRLVGMTVGASVLQDTSYETGADMYRPPESLTGAAATIQGDIYALGVLLYQMILADLDRPIGQGWEADIDDPLLRDDIAACIDRRPEARLRSAADLAERLRTLDSRRANAHRQRRQKRRERTAVQVAILGVVLALVGGFLAWNENRRVRQMERLADAFSEGVINILNPSSGIPANIKAAEGLESRFREMQESDPLPPTVYAKPIHVLARVFRRNSMYDHARTLADEALTIRRTHLGERHPDTIASLFEYAGALHQLGHYDEALELKRTVVTLSNSNPAVSVAMRIAALSDLASLQRDMGFLEEALDNFTLVRELSCDQSHPGKPDDCANAQHNLGDCLLRLGKLDEAEPHLLSALQSRLSRYDEHHAYIASSRSLLGKLRSAQRRHDEAVDQLEQALDIRSTALGAAHEFTLITYSDLAAALIARNAPTDIARALQHHDHAITAARDSTALGPDHPTTAMFLLRRARFHADHADTPAAAADLLAAEPALSRLSPRHHLVTQAAALRAAIGTPIPVPPDRPGAPRS